ncbi:hypothetical protein M407DRAFT_3977 [Tulasnella calospora MUT 4182]|uniref:Uncharacterized protein n=1 Tax=Tulasnella calospora MUT 4182 TaxID=1051891 RepID=A0A0C3QWW1_9AGAM|nr:hypothetical protein M407DRAFT_3977 [Tulasnella calospora MUT 4182]
MTGIDGAGCSFENAKDERKTWMEAWSLEKAWRDLEANRCALGCRDAGRRSGNWLLSDPTRAAHVMEFSVKKKARILNRTYGGDRTQKARHGSRRDNPVVQRCEVAKVDRGSTVFWPKNLSSGGDRYAARRGKALGPSRPPATTPTTGRLRSVQKIQKRKWLKSGKEREQKRAQVLHLKDPPRSAVEPISPKPQMSSVRFRKGCCIAKLASKTGRVGRGTARSPAPDERDSATGSTASLRRGYAAAEYAEGEPIERGACTEARPARGEAEKHEAFRGVMKNHPSKTSWDGNPTPSRTDYTFPSDTDTRTLPPAETASVSRASTPHRSSYALESVSPSRRKFDGVFRMA